MHLPRSRPAAAALVAAVVVAALTGCASAAGTTADASDSAASTAGFPVTIENCGSEVTLDAAPRRIVLVNNDALANLEALNAIDRVVAVTTTPAAGLYDQATYDAIASLDVLSTETNATGGSVVSQESILGMNPDLVIAPESAVDREALTAAGIAVFSPTAYCSDPPAAYTETATFQRVWDELAVYGRLLGEADAAAALTAQAQDELAALSATDNGTAAALYVSSGGSVLSPYGGPSMVTPVFEAAGLRNVYADVDDRVFDANLEDIIARDPGTIVLLYSGDDADAVKDAFLSAPGVEALSAVQNDRVIALPFPYTDPPTVLTAQGPAVLGDLLAALS